MKITQDYPSPSPLRSINRAGPGDGGGSRWGCILYVPLTPALSHQSLRLETEGRGGWTNYFQGNPNNQNWERICRSFEIGICDFRRHALCPLPYAVLR